MNEAMSNALRGVGVSYRDYRLSLIANQPQEINVGGNYWQIISQTASADITLEFDDKDRISRRSGTGGPSVYQRVRVQSTVDQVVVISLGYTGGMAPYDRSVATFGGTLNLSYAVPSATTDVPDVSVPGTGTAALTANNANRRGVTIHNPSTSAGPVRIGGGSVGAARGHMLEPGADITIEGTQGVSAYNPNASPVVLSILDQTL